MTQSPRITDKPRPRSGYLTPLCWLIALVWTAALPGISGAQTHPFRTVLAPPSIFASLSGGNAGADLDGPLSATVSGAPDVNSESTIKGPVWVWSIQSVQFRAKDTDAWAPATDYHTEHIVQVDTSKSDADLKACLKRAGQWKFTLKVTVDYSDTSNGDTWHGENTADVTTGVSLNATVTAVRVGGTGPDVAAGAINNDGHKANIRVTVSPAVAGVYVPAPIISSGGRGQYDNITAAVSLSAVTTDANGIVQGTFTSGNLDEVTVVTIPTDGQGGGPSVSITQHWTENLDDASNPAWAYDPGFEYNTPSPLAFSPEFNDNGWVPIKDHSMSFATAWVDGEMWDPEAGDIGDDGLPLGDFVSTSFDLGDQSMDDTTRNWLNGLVTYSPGIATGWPYSTQQTISADPNFYIDDVEFTATDHNSFQTGY